ncbi:MAG: GAF domain-containing protein [Dehalococcoidales bacterium]|nr:MAG: GAF domain-containing protein [Dehalococcoidales bacterium]
MNAQENNNDLTRLIIDSLEDELMIIDEDYVIVLANEALITRHKKADRNDILGRHCYEISHAISGSCFSSCHTCPVKEVWETGNTVRVVHVHQGSSHGENIERYVEIMASPIKDEQGNITMITELMRDITDIKRIEFLAGKAHQDLLALHSIAGVVSQSLDIDIVLSNALDKTLEIMRRSSGGILILDGEKQTLSYKVHRGLSYTSERTIRLGEGITGKVAQTGDAILVDDILKDPRAAHLDHIIAEGLRSFACVPLLAKNKILGVLTVASHEYGKFSVEDTRFLDNVAAQISIALENSMLLQDVRQQKENRGELLQDMISLQEAERKRIARELHDETSQVLASLAASLEAAVSILSTNPEKAKNLIKKAQALSVNILDEINNLVYELRPSLLDDLGLVAAVRWLSENKLVKENITVNFKPVGEMSRLTTQMETALFRVTQEALNNIARHSRAKSVNIRLHFKKNAVKLQIGDDGIGFDVEEAINSKERPRGLGLLGMRERIESMNGTLNILSQYEGGGTEINIEIPLI